MREFNITGLCIPKMHYMVDISGKIDKIADLIDKGLYFTINRARQFGKTTTLFAIRNRLRDKYLVIDTSFEGIGEEAFKSIEAFCSQFIDLFSAGLKKEKVDDLIIADWDNGILRKISELSKKITGFCARIDKPIVLLIDEVDKTSNNQVYLDFLGMLRDKYLNRNKGDDTTFQSVILGGVYDIKNLKRKITGEEILNARGERVYNSPWNIATDFLLDMSFNPGEIATMLVEYELDHQTGMDITAISHELYRYTNGYPFLVSKLCKTIDERLEKDWSVHGVEDAVKLLLQEKNTLFDDMSKNIINNSKLYDLVYAVMIEGEDIPFSVAQPEIELGEMFGILMNKNGYVAVANEIFELYITNYLSADIIIKKHIRNTVLVKDEAIRDGKLDMQLILEKFGEHFYEIYRIQDEAFLEKHGRLLFITYLKPFINGLGFYHIESETRNSRRMDIAVDYGAQQFIIELKIWSGEKKHEDAYGQLSDYLDAKKAKTGYLLTFDFRKREKSQKAEWVQFGDKRIFDVII